jgi:hypothetical protein
MPIETGPLHGPKATHADALGLNIFCEEVQGAGCKSEDCVQEIALPQEQKAQWTRAWAAKQPQPKRRPAARGSIRASSTYYTDPPPVPGKTSTVPLSGPSCPTSFPGMAPLHTPLASSACPRTVSDYSLVDTACAKAPPS